MEREIDLGHSIAKSELGWEATLSNIGTAVRSTPMGLTRYIWWNILLFFFYSIQLSKWQERKEHQRPELTIGGNMLQK